MSIVDTVKRRGVIPFRPVTSAKADKVMPSGGLRFKVKYVDE